MSNEELIRFRIEDPISASRGTNGGLLLSGGHHRAAEIARRVTNGQLARDVAVQFLLHD